MERNNENIIIRNDKIKRLERIYNLKIEEDRKLINDKYNKIQNMKEQQLRINERKREVKDEIARRKREYEEQFSKMFHKKDIDDKMLLKIQKMFPDNERINQLLKR